ncbi:hypothetical protein RFI_06371, partial [Reticulomyxa filosa]
DEQSKQNEEAKDEKQLQLEKIQARMAARSQRRIVPGRTMSNVEDMKKLSDEKLKKEGKKSQQPPKASHKPMMSDLSQIAPTQNRTIGNIPLLKQANQRLREYRANHPKTGPRQVTFKQICIFKKGDKVYFISKDEEQYAPGEVEELNERSGFWRIKKIVTIPENLAEDDPSRYIRTKPVLCKPEGFYKLMHENDFGLAFQISLLHILRDEMKDVVNKKKKHQRHLTRINVVQKQIQHAQTIKDVHKESVTNLKLLMEPKPTQPKTHKFFFFLKKIKKYRKLINSELDTDEEEIEKKTTETKRPKSKRSATVVTLEEAKIPTGEHQSEEQQSQQVIEIDYANASMPAGDVKDWDINDVQKWLMYISSRRPKNVSKDKPIIPFFQLYYSMFYARQVNGAKLIEQTSNTLANDLLIKNAHRSTLLAFIDELRTDKKKIKKENQIVEFIEYKDKRTGEVKKRKAGPRDAGKMVDYEIPDYGGAEPNPTTKTVVKVTVPDQKNVDNKNGEQKSGDKKKETKTDPEKKKPDTLKAKEHPKNGCKGSKSIRDTQTITL